MRVVGCYVFGSCLRTFYEGYSLFLYSRRPNGLPAKTTLDLDVVGSNLCL